MIPLFQDPSVSTGDLDSGIITWMQRSDERSRAVPPCGETEKVSHRFVDGSVHESGLKGATPCIAANPGTGSPCTSGTAARAQRMPMRSCGGLRIRRLFIFGRGDSFNPTAPGLTESGEAGPGHRHRDGTMARRTPSGLPGWTVVASLVSRPGFTSTRHQEVRPSR